MEKARTRTGVRSDYSIRGVCKIVVVNERCFICGNLSAFEIMEGATCFREARCNHCGARVRNSDIANVISKTVSANSRTLGDCRQELMKMNILEAQASGPIHRVLNQLPGYVGFEYFDNITPGKYVNGILCNDLERLTFADNSFDIVITQDVLEHIANPGKAFAEINRVLKENGRHIFTVPFHEGRPTVFRSGLPEVYHGDPIRKNGAPVRTDWGEDMGLFIERHGMKTSSIIAHKFYEPQEITNVDRSYQEYLTIERIKYFRYNSVVFISQKIRQVC